MPGPQRRTKSQTRHSAATWMLGIVGLKEYDGDPKGVKRLWYGSERESLYHGEHHMPAFPLMGDNLIWMFRKTSDVSSDSWRIVESGSGTQLALQDERGGVAKAVLGAGNDNYQYYFARQENAQIPVDCTLVFETQIRIKDVDQADLFVGLAASLGRGNLFEDRVDAAGFYLVDGSAALAVETRLAGVATQTTGQETLADDTFIRLGMNITCKSNESYKSVSFYCNGQHRTTHLTNIPTTELAFCFGLRNGEAVANEISVKTSVLLQT